MWSASGTVTYATVIPSWYFGTCCFQALMTSSNGNIFRVTGLSCGEFTGPGDFPTQRPVTRSFDVFFDLHLNKQLSKQPWGWWFETPSWSLWRQCNGRWINYSYLTIGPFIAILAIAGFVIKWSKLKRCKQHTNINDIKLPILRTHST